MEPLPGVVAIINHLHPSIAALSHVVETLSAQLDYSTRWNIETASAVSDLRLLDRVYARLSIQNGSLPLAYPLRAWISSKDDTPLSEEIIQQVRNALNTSAREGRFEVVKWLMAHYQYQNVTSAMEKAARGGHLEVMSWLYLKGNVTWTKKMTHVAAIEGHFHIVKWLEQFSSVGLTDFTMDCAADHGNFEMIKWLHEMCCEASVYAMDNAARKGYLDIVQWLHANRQEGCTTGAMDSAASEGHLAVLQWLHANRTEGCTEKALEYAAMNGHTNTVKWMHRYITKGDRQRAFHAAIQWGHLEIAQYLLANCEECQIQDSMLDLARNNGRTEVLRWLETTQYISNSEKNRVHTDVK